MNEIKPSDYEEISNLLDDASLCAIRLVGEGLTAAQGARVEAAIAALRGVKGDEGIEAAGPITVAFDGAKALGFSFEPGRKKPSETAWPSAAQCLAIMNECEGCNLVYFAHANEEWLSDALSAPALVWAHGNEAAFVTAERTFVFAIEHGVRIDGYMHSAWVLIAAAGVTAMDDSGPLTIETWSDQTSTWWKGWKTHWNDEEADEDEPSPFSAAIPAGEEKPYPSAPPLNEPLFDLAPHDLPGELLAAVKTWVESEHAKRDDATYCAFIPYVREVVLWWVEDARAQVNVLGMNHRRATDKSPAFSRVEQFTIVLARRSGVWVVTRPSYCAPDADDVTRRPWVRAWRSGRVGYPPWYACAFYRLNRKLTRSGT